MNNSLSKPQQEVNPGCGSSLTEQDALQDSWEQVRKDAEDSNNSELLL